MDHETATPPPADVTAHRAALLLADALHAIGIEITSVREAFPQLGESGVRVGVLTPADAMTLHDLLRAEETRRAADAIAEADGGCEQ